ncbi:hypothetical protein [Roseateles toxinivorans]|uniref:Lipoprotein n=1 Tax=Roseateles toxinivorans TaxID=270368 RepID=A0A4R6QMX2_9BURK|nr:hypothetical protein [Roseateles toxinivorans]TDP64205.1 hypothetical protein DES47_104494 [Roseateles toxinivorans]
MIKLPALFSVLILAGCASGPPPPDWQMNAKASLERATEAYLSGNTRVEVAEFARARAELARTGRADLLARAELTRCAVRVASLEFDDCPAFAALAQDAQPAERAYANYLAGRATATDATLLPNAQRQLVSGGTAAIAAMPEPLSRLVAAGVLLRSSRAEPALYAMAADTASAQGWSRPLLAWLHLQAQRAEAAADAELAARLRRRIELVLNPVKP